MIATPSVNRSNTQRASVHLNIINKNDNSPRFSNRTYAANVLENAPDSTQVIQVQVSKILPHVSVLIFEFVVKKNLYRILSDISCDTFDPREGNGLIKLLISFLLAFHFPSLDVESSQALYHYRQIRVTVADSKDCASV